MALLTLRTLGLAGIVAASCMSLARPTSAANEPPSAANEPRKIEIAAKRFEYSPSEITLKKGEPVVLVLHSQDVAHGLKISEFNLQTEIGKGASVELPLTPDKAGDFVGHCSHFCGEGHGGMALTLHVTE